MKKYILSIACILVLNISVVSAAELIWYLAASLTVPAKKVVSLYNQQSKSDKVLLIIGGSGQLLSQIQLSKKGDIYSPASRHYLEKCQLLNLTRQQKPFLLQTPVFGLSAQGAQKVKTFSDLSAPDIRISLGNPKAMALGRLYQKIEAKMDRNQASAIRKNTTLQALNVTQIANYLKKNIIDAGIVFNTVAIAHKIPYIEIPEAYNVPSESFWIELTSGKHTAAVNKFEKFVEMNYQIFERYGYKKPAPEGRLKN